MVLAEFGTRVLCLWLCSFFFIPTEWDIPLQFSWQLCYLWVDSVRSAKRFHLCMYVCSCFIICAINKLIGFSLIDFRFAWARVCCVFANVRISLYRNFYYIFALISTFIKTVPMSFCFSFIYPSPPWCAHFFRIHVTYRAHSKKKRSRNHTKRKESAKQVLVQIVHTWSCGAVTINSFFF